MVSQVTRPLVCISNAAWNAALPTNRQQLPLRLAAYTQVLYVSPFSLGRVLLGRDSLRNFNPRLRQVRPNFHVADSLQLLTMARGQIWPFKQMDETLRLRMIRSAMSQLGMARPVLWLYFPPDFSHLKGHLGESLVVYHCTDDYVGYAEKLGWDVARIQREEQELIRRADVVLVTSRPLYNKHAGLNPGGVYLMPNVADVALFNQVVNGKVAPAPELAGFNHPVAGFVGSLDSYKVDFPLVAGLAHRLPDWSFVFVGPVGKEDGTTPSDLPQAGNIHYLGSRPHADLPSFVAGFDVCMIPYQINSYTQGVFPLKVWEYLAAGKPVVSTPLPALSEYTEWISLAGQVEPFAQALLAANTSADGSSNAERIRARVQEASQHSWEKRAAEVMDLLAQFGGIHSV